MYTDSIQARREIARNFTELNYRINPLHWQTLCMGVNRDLQAKKLRPNVPVPSRRKVIPFLKMMHKETGSMLKAILAFGFDGPWTSSGGSFRLAREIGFDIAPTMRKIFTTKTVPSPSLKLVLPGQVFVLKKRPAIRRRFPGLPRVSGSSLGRVHSCISPISRHGTNRCQRG
ncbi:hypothetical protein AB9D29_23300 [Enterobacter quasihormaechei]|uniref:hypothetical protein n=1 Tax=Enterobacter quasihormaechei TaxID=2529382 RepID=UPI00350F8982